MNILQRLAKLANNLDQEGLYEEASMLDSVIKEAQEPTYEAAPPGFRETFHQEPMGYSDPSPGAPTDFSAQQDKFQAEKIRKLKRRFRVINLVRNEVGLSRKSIPSDQELKFWSTLSKGDPKRELLSPYDRALSRKLTIDYAGVLSSRQTPMSLLRAVRDFKSRTFDFAQGIPPGPGQLGPGEPDEGIAGQGLVVEE